MTSDIICADVMDGLRLLEDGSVQMVCTSPPYWNMRDYGVEGQIGLEPTLEEYIARIVGVFGEVRRVLRDDSTLWLNLGDRYNNRGCIRASSHQPSLNGITEDSWRATAASGGVHMSSHSSGLKEKDLVGIPWRVAFALQADGWWLRSDIVWSKPACMPEPVKDRPTRSHEYVFLLTKSARYFYDADAVRSPLAAKTYTTFGTEHRAQGNDAGGNNKSDNWGRSVHTRKPRLATPKQDSPSGGGQRYAGFNARWDAAESRGEIAGANLRTVWTIATEGFPEAHFATFPKALVEPCIKAGSARGDTVLDPFCGSGTTGIVARQLGRHFVGIELNPEYADMARRRIEEEGRPKESAPLKNSDNARQEGLFND